MAAYEQPGFVAVITDKGGVPFDEFNDNGRRTVKVPFDSEYKIKLKNKTKGRAFARLTIDGRYILGKPSAKIILRAGETVDLERFVDKMDEGDAFKFVSALAGAGVQDPTSGDNGRVQIIFEPEKASPHITHTVHTGVATSIAMPPGSGFGSGGGILRSMSARGMGGGAGSVIGTAGGGSMGMGGAGSVEASMNASNAAMGGGAGVTNTCFHVGAVANSSGAGMIMDMMDTTDKIALDTGATVHGSKSFQKFENSNEWFLTGAPVVLDIWMRGLVEAARTLPYVLDAKAFLLSVNGNAAQQVMSWEERDSKVIIAMRHGGNLTVARDCISIFS